MIDWAASIAFTLILAACMHLVRYLWRCYKRKTDPSYVWPTKPWWR